MGNSSGHYPLTDTSEWKPAIASTHFLHDKLPADAAARCLEHCDAATLCALSQTCTNFHAAGRAVDHAK